MRKSHVYNCRLFCIGLLIGWQVILSSTMVAQPHYAAVLKEAEMHSPVLLAAQKRAEARQAEAHVGALIPNPEIEAAFFLGDPTMIGTRWDLSVSQSFEMPSVTVRKARLRKLQDEAAGIDYRIIRNAVLLEVQLTCADLIYYNALAGIYSRRCAAANGIVQLYRQRYVAGDCSILDYNRAQMNLADVMSQAEDNALHVDNTKHDLCRLVGVEDYSLRQIDYDDVVVDSSFGAWYEKAEMQNPSLQMLNNQVETARQQSQLRRAEWLPDMSVGYASENVVGSTFRGVKVGMTIPLWSQQRAVSAARMAQEAVQEEFAIRREETSSKLRCMFHRLKSLQQSVANLKETFRQCNSIELLDKALQAGEISLEQYLQQVDYYYGIEMQLWATAHELEQLHLQLQSVTL